MDVLAFRNRAHAQNDAYLNRSKDMVLTKQRVMALIIGILALFLAFGVAFLDAWFDPVCARTSISHYFYEPLAGTFFVLTLSFVGAFMIAYEGENRLDGWLATLGGVGGLILAFFPTDGIGCAVGQLVDLRPMLTAEVPPEFGVEAKPWPDTFLVEAQAVRIGGQTTQALHFVGAGLMFAVLWYFSAVVFTRIGARDHVAPNTDGRTGLRLEKQIRNAVYVFFTLVMTLGIALVVFSSAGWAQNLSLWMARGLAVPFWANNDFAEVARPVYHGEMLALMAFGFSWLTKGRYFVSAYRLLTGAVH